MRKTLSIVLGLIMIVSLFSFGTSAAEGEAIKDAAGFAAMKEDGKYYLDADISISASYDKNFVGVLDGNGHTVTVTAPLFAEFGGTVKNLTMAGAQRGVFVTSATGNVVLENVIARVKDKSKAFLAMHIDFDEANAACVNDGTKAFIVKRW